MSTPKEVVNAFFPDVQQVGNYTLRPLTIGTLLLLEKLDSPFVTTSVATGERKPPEPLDVGRALYVLTLTDEQIQELYSGLDKKALDDKAWKLVFSLPAREQKRIVAALRKLFDDSTSTMIGGSEEAGDQEEDADEAKKKMSASKNSTAKARTTASAGS